MSSLTECVVEQAAVAWLESLGYAIKHGPKVVGRAWGSKERIGRIRQIGRIERNKT